MTILRRSVLLWAVFDIPADNPERAKEFYSDLFGWKIEKFQGAEDYWHIDTGGANETPDGRLMKRMHSEQPITNYVAVSSVDESAKKVEQLGGKMCKAKTAILHMGYFAVHRVNTRPRKCLDFATPLEVYAQLRHHSPVALGT